jgi:hypothetical protein
MGRAVNMHIPPETARRHSGNRRGAPGRREPQCGIAQARCGSSAPSPLSPVRCRRGWLKLDQARDRNTRQLSNLFGEFQPQLVSSVPQGPGLGFGHLRPLSKLRDGSDPVLGQ